MCRIKPTTPQKINKQIWVTQSPSLCAYDANATTEAAAGLFMKPCVLSQRAGRRFIKAALVVTTAAVVVEGIAVETAAKRA